MRFVKSLKYRLSKRERINAKTKETCNFNALQSLSIFESHSVGLVRLKNRQQEPISSSVSGYLLSKMYGVVILQSEAERTVKHSTIEADRVGGVIPPREGRAVIRRKNKIGSRAGKMNPIRVFGNRQSTSRV